jgi:hypothetical protein
MSKINNWEKFKAISNFMSVIVIPVVIGVLGHIYSQSLKEREIQVKFVELSLQILKEKPEEANKNIRIWAIDVINQYSEVKLKSQVKKDLIEKVPITTNQIFKSSFDIPVINKNTPVQVTAVIGDGNIGKVRVVIDNLNGKRISEFDLDGSSKEITIPDLNLEDNKYLKVTVVGMVTNTNSETKFGTIHIDFLQNKKSIGRKSFQFQFEEHMQSKVFKLDGKIFLKE